MSQGFRFTLLMISCGAFATLFVLPRLPLPERLMIVPGGIILVATIPALFRRAK